MSERRSINPIAWTSPMPDYYVKGREYEPRRVIEDWDLNWNLGTALKYIARAGRKDSAIDDLIKAKHYIEFELERQFNECLGEKPGKFDVETLQQMWADSKPITLANKSAL